MNTTEKKTIGKMIYMYCKAKHGTSHALCTSCAELNKYAQKKLSKCVYGDDKPTCQNCTIHCYSDEMREKIKEVMKYSGMRLLIHSPILAIKHSVKGFKSSKNASLKKHDLCDLEGSNPK